MDCRNNNGVIYRCTYYVAFCTKYRRRVLVEGVDERFKLLAQAVADEYSFEIVDISVVADYVQLIIDVSPQFGIHKAVKRIKARTSHDLREEYQWLRSRIPTLWTNSYFVATVGMEPQTELERYLEAQKQV